MCCLWLIWFLVCVGSEIESKDVDNDAKEESVEDKLEREESVEDKALEDEGGSGKEEVISVLVEGQSGSNVPIVVTLITFTDLQGCIEHKATAEEVVKAKEE